MRIPGPGAAPAKKKKEEARVAAKISMCHYSLIGRRFGAIPHLFFLLVGSARIAPRDVADDSRRALVNSARIRYYKDSDNKRLTRPRRLIFRSLCTHSFSCLSQDAA